MNGRGVSLGRNIAGSDYRSHRRAGQWRFFREWRGRGAVVRRRPRWDCQIWLMRLRTLDKVLHSSG